LDLLSRNVRQFNTILNGDDRLLETLFIDLMAAKAVTIRNNQYVITETGTKSYNLFMDKYYEYLKVYDVYSLVDINTAEFAFSKYFDFGSDEEWEAYKTDPRFLDLRIAVALFKNINIAECVFMSFVNDGRFDTESEGWQMDLVSTAIWDEIEAICATAYKPEQLGNDSMVNIINQGSQIMVELVKKEAEKDAEIEAALAHNEAVDAANTPIVTTTVTIEEEVIEEEPEWVYYESYYDPYYVPLFWYDPIFIW
jgi:hypothetical protein